MARSEASIQTAVVNYARSKGLLAKKLSTMGPMGNAGWPDYMFLRAASGIPTAFFIEFKKPGGKLTDLQVHMRHRLAHMGFHYWVVDDAEHGRNLIDAELSRAV